MIPRSVLKGISPCLNCLRTRNLQILQNWRFFMCKVLHSRNISVTSEGRNPIEEERGDGDEEVVAIRKTRTKSTKNKNPSPNDPVVVKPSPAVKAVLDYISEHSGLSVGENRYPPNVLPRRAVRQTRIEPKLVYLVDKFAASTFSQAIQSQNPDRDAPVVESNPGIGLLTSELINGVGFKYITCLESDTTLRERLEKSLKVTTVNASLEDLPRIHHIDKKDGGERINTILSQIKTGPSTENLEKQLYVIGTIPHIHSINFLIRTYVTSRLFYEDELKWSGATLFIAVGSKVHHIVTATPKAGFVAYRATSVLFQTLFTFKELGTIPRQAYIPWETPDGPERTGVKGRRMSVDDPNMLRILQVEINHEVQERIGKENLLTFWYFVRQNLMARKNRIIPELERWIPGCGLTLIRQGFTIYSKFGDLQPHEMLDLYLQFVSWPEFHNSSFLNAVEKYQTRMEINEDDDDSVHYKKDE